MPHRGNQRSHYQHPLDHCKSERIPEKHLLLLYWLRQSLWLCRSQQTVKFFKRWEYQTTWPASREIWMQVKKQQLELDMGLVPTGSNWTGSKLRKDYVKAVYCNPAYLTCMQSTLCKMLDWMSWSSFFECWVLSQFFPSPLSLSSKGSLVLQFLP